MKQEYFDICWFIILLDFHLTDAWNFNDYFPSDKNEKTISDRDRFFKFDLVQLPSKPRISSKTFIKTRIPKYKQFDPLARRKPNNLNDQFVWDESGKFWTYKKTYDTYPTYYDEYQDNGRGGPVCKPPFCYPRKCNKMKCPQSNCVMQSNLCVRNNVECGVGQKQISVGSEVICLNSASENNCSPECGEHGICIKNKCYCETGYRGESCLIMDADLCKQKFQLSCTYGCTYDKRMNNFNCICGEKEAKVDCIDVKPCGKGCKNGGICVLGKCRCAEGFDGDECQFEISACSPGQMGNKTCSQLCINDGKEKFQCKCMKSYHLNDDGRSCDKNKCSPNGTLEQLGDVCKCKPGWKGLFCSEDIDECVEFRKCDQICINTIGSYQCTCIEGFKLTVNGKCAQNCPNNCSRNGDCFTGQCTCFGGWYGVDCSMDINECKYNHGCQQKCLNTPGSFTCECIDGYALQSDMRHCLPTPCRNECKNNEVCENNTCVCPPVYKKPECKDFNYCYYLKGCEHDCNITNNTIFCTCRTGYKLVDDKKSCKKECKCNNGHCTNDVCVCNKGFSGTDCNEYRNDCSSNPYICQHTCINVPGNYKCQCYDGYFLNSDNRTCSLKVCPIECKNGKCQNGKCECNIGFQGQFCDQRVDECLDKHECEQLCISGFGNYKCDCIVNFTLASDGRSCINDKCKQCRHGKCEKDGSCKCKSGFQGIWCDEDVDECSRHKGICEHNCINTIGSYKCFCKPGFRLQDDQLSCTVLCSACKNGKCDYSGKCKCQSGWMGDLCDIDVNECLIGTHQCQQNCININGSYTCSCNQSYYISNFDGRSCIKKSDNCEIPCKNEGKCIDNKCVCKPGFTGNLCQDDINECLLSSFHKCLGTCINTYGNYECICPRGFVVLNDQKTCKSSPKDTMCTPHCLNGGVCQDMIRCRCPTGFIGRDCSKDVDECKRYKPCGKESDKDKGICFNTYGSYYCKCPPGSVLKLDGTRCMKEEDAKLRPHLIYRGRGTKGVTRLFRN